MANYIRFQKKVLKDLCVWSKMSKAEKKEFMNCSTEIEVDRLKRTMMSRYF